MASTITCAAILAVLLFASCKAMTTGISQTPVTAAVSPTSCRLPNSTYCGIDYSVPDIIATLAPVIEEEIRGRLEFDLMPGEELDECLLTRKEIVCAQRFPKCVESNVLLTSTENCVQKLQTSCNEYSLEYLNVLCALQTESVPLGECSAINSFAGWSALEHCNVLDDNIHVTEWMYKLIQLTDEDLSTILSQNSVLHMLAPHCSSNYARYFCQFLGECAEDSSEIKIINNYHFCEETRTCYDDAVAETLRGTTFPCDQWAKLDYKVAPSVEPSATPAPIGSATTGNSGGGGGGMISIIPEHRTLPEFSGALSVHSHLTVTALLLTLWACLL